MGPCYCMLLHEWWAPATACYFGASWYHKNQLTDLGPYTGQQLNSLSATA